MLTSAPGDDSSNVSTPRDTFETTHWSIVLAAGQPALSAEANQALETLCRSYWQPLFVYVRRRGYSPEDAEDLVQAFFARILARRDLQAVRRERGRFRSYLLSSLKNFLINDWHRGQAEKRGGGQVPIALDELIRTQSPDLAAEDGRSSDAAYDRQWALAVLARVLDRLRDEARADDNEHQFNLLQGFLTGNDPTRAQADIAAELGMTENAVKQAVFRLRQRYQKLLRLEIAQTVATAGDVEEELRHLIAALRH